MVGELLVAAWTLLAFLGRPCRVVGTFGDVRESWVCWEDGQGLLGSQVLMKQVPRVRPPPSCSSGSSKIPSWGRLEKREDYQKPALYHGKQIRLLSCHFLY